MIDKNSKYPEREFEMAPVSGHFRALFSTPKSTAMICAKKCI